MPDQDLRGPAVGRRAGSTTEPSAHVGSRERKREQPLRMPQKKVQLTIFRVIWFISIWLYIIITCWFIYIYGYWVIMIPETWKILCWFPIVCWKSNSNRLPAIGVTHQTNSKGIQDRWPGSDAVGRQKKIILPSGKLTVCDIENGPVEIVDLPTKKCDFP